MKVEHTTKTTDLTESPQPQKTIFSLLFALRNNEKVLLERNIADFTGEKDYCKIKKTCTAMHGSLFVNPDQRLRYKYAKKVFHTLMKPAYFIYKISYQIERENDELNCHITSCCTTLPRIALQYASLITMLAIGIPSLLIATFAAGCTFFVYAIKDKLDITKYNIRNLELSKLPPGLSTDIFDIHKKGNCVEAHQRSNQAFDESDAELAHRYAIPEARKKCI